MEIIEIKRPMKMNNFRINNDEDEYSHLQYVIEAKRNMLLKKQKRLQKIAKQNAFLENIKNDYLKYNNYIVKQKQDQITALHLLNNYIGDLSKSGELSEHNIQDAKIEQKNITKELNSIKTGLDKIMNESNQVQGVLFNQERKDKKR